MDVRNVRFGRSQREAGILVRVYKVRGINLNTLQAWDEFIGSSFQCKSLIEVLKAKRGSWKVNPNVFAMVRVKE